MCAAFDRFGALRCLCCLGGGKLVFCSTLVDRIVTLSQDTAKEYWSELGYEDCFWRLRSLFALRVIESGSDISPKAAP
jgi:mannitol-1-phosphate/altronate dehydrogenase